LLIPTAENSIFRVHAHPRDMPESTGKGGHPATALRVILGANDVKLGRCFTLDFALQERRSQ
jgi:predicted RNA-binding protein YlqC (UPF0109 family)